MKKFVKINENTFSLQETPIGVPDVNMFNSFTNASKEMRQIHDILTEIDQVGGNPPSSMMDEIKQHSQAAIQHLMQMVQSL